DNVWRRSDHLRDMLLDRIAIGPRVPIVDVNIAPFDPTRITHAQAKRSETIVRFWIIFGDAKQYANTSRPLRLLRTRRERPCCPGAAEKRDELAPPHCPSQAGEAHRSGSNWEVGSGQTDARQCPLCARARSGPKRKTDPVHRPTASAVRA